MSRRELNRAVANATGESVEAIERRGFQVVDDRRGTAPLILDWENAEAARLDEVLSDEDWCERIDALPSHDEDFDDEPFACTAFCPDAG